MVDHSHRATIFVEDATVLQHDHVDADQHILRLNAPKTAARATPGTFVHIRCDESLPMRRPLSLMRVDANEGWIDLLFKTVGEGTRQLARRTVGEQVNVLGPIGNGFTPTPTRRRPVLIGGGVGIPPMVFLAETLRPSAGGNDFHPIVFMGSEVPFPFAPKPSEILVDGMPPGAIACLPLLDDWGIPSRLASLQGFAGCYDGYVTDLAANWLGTLGEQELAEVEIFACGPTPMLSAAAQVAQKFGLPSQLCLEEFMACAVGGCAGCVVQVVTPDGPAMKRVCVDGPVFEGTSVFPQAPDNLAQR